MFYIGPMKTLTLAFLLACSGAHAVNPALLPLDFDADGRYVKEVTVLPTKFIELCGKLQAGKRVVWRFDATGPLNFNVHYHEGKSKVTYPAKVDGAMKAQAALDVAVERDYCWMWTNQSAEPVVVTVELLR